MKVDGKHYRTIWIDEDDCNTVKIIDQRALPHRFTIEDVKTYEFMATVIKDMHVRGAGLIGAAAGYGMYLAASSAPKESVDAFEKYVERAGKVLKATRPTAVNLEFAVARQLEAMAALSTVEERLVVAKATAGAIADEDASFCVRLGQHGKQLIRDIYEKKKEKEGDKTKVNILTHCNAGWLAFVDVGSATAPIYAAHDDGIPVHVYVDETRPRNQGASLTCWELGKHGVEHTLVADNTGGHLMQHGLVDIVITGADRVLASGDVCNKIGTYLKALAAKDNSIPFYVALPSSTFDWVKKDGVSEIPIELRDAREVRYISGLLQSKKPEIGTDDTKSVSVSEEGEVVEVLLCPASSNAANYAFDVTPARLVTALVTERGVCKANEEAILALFPEKESSASRKKRRV